MNRHLSTLVLLMLAITGADHAQPAPTPSAPPKVERVLIGITPADVEPLRLLPPPPLDGSPAQKEELERLRRIQKDRTPERLAQAWLDDGHEDARAFASVLGPRFDLDHLPATRLVMEIAKTDSSVAASMAKTAFHRHRPWMFDDSLVGCGRGKKVDPLSSYPSGHTTLGYTLAIVLADLVPARAAAIMERASDYGYSRLVCEVHYPSDVVAGQALGTATGLLLLHSAVLADKLNAARAELMTAGIR